MLKKIFYFLILLLLFMCVSYTGFAKDGDSIKPGLYICNATDFKDITARKEGVEEYTWPNYDYIGRLVDPLPEFNLLFKIEIMEISEEEFNIADGLNVIRDLTYKGKNKCYSINIMIGYDEANLKRVDYTYIKEMVGGHRYEYIYDRGFILCWDGLLCIGLD